MSRSIIRTATTAIAIAALAAPTALAQPADTPPAVAQAAAKAHQKQDLRSAHARDAARLPRARGHAVNAPGATAVDSATRPPLAGPPTWPVNPQPITSAPAAKVTDGGNGVDWQTIGLGIAGSLLAIGAIAGITSRARRTGRTRIAA